MAEETAEEGAVERLNEFDFGGGEDYGGEWREGEVWVGGGVGG